jgi:aminoglycoside 6'-N-acetyltransferase I
MSQIDLHIEILGPSQRIPYDLLQLADPSKTHIEAYLAKGTCYLAKIGDETIGAMVLQELDGTIMELKNIAVSPSQQGRGYGKVLLEYAIKTCGDSGYNKLIVGTGNSSIGQLAFYQKSGFEIDHVIKNHFLDHYAEPIFEDGIQCKHMVVLEKRLS